MKIITTGVAGTMESSDIIVRIEPKETSGIELSLESDVKQQYGDRIEQVIRETLAAMGVESAYVSAVDIAPLKRARRQRLTVRQTAPIINLRNKRIAHLVFKTLSERRKGALP